MLQKNRFYIAAIFVALSIVAAVFQNCAEEMDMSAYSNQGSSAAGDSSQPAVITSAPTSLTFTLLAPYSVTVVATGKNLVYRWYKGDILLPEFTGNTFSGSQAQEGMAGNYRVEVENSKGMDSRNFVVAVSRLPNQVPPIITTQVTPLSSFYYMRAADNVGIWFPAQIADAANYNLATFSVGATGDGLTYQWYFIDGAGNAATIPGATGASYAFKVTSLSQVGAYRVSVRNAFGEVTSQAALTSTVTAPYLGIQYGGLGGMVAPVQSCPVGSYGVGFTVRVGQYVDRAAMFCGNPNVTVTTAGMGGFGGTAVVNLVCPADKYLVGVNYATGTYVDRIQGVCGDKNGLNVTVTAFAGGNGGVLRAVRCPAGFAVSELRGRAQNYVDALQVVCTFAY